MSERPAQIAPGVCLFPQPESFVVYAVDSAIDAVHTVHVKLCE